MFLSLFFWVHKSISGNSHHVHQYIFIFLRRSFFKRVVLMRRAKSRRAEERPEQSRAMGRANEELFRRKEKSTRRISTLFSSFLLFWVLRLSGLFSLFFWVVSRVCTHFFAKKTERKKPLESTKREIPQKRYIKFKLCSLRNNKRYITNKREEVLFLRERGRENKKNRRDWYYIIAVVLKCRERANNNNNNNNQGVPE